MSDIHQMYGDQVNASNLTPAQLQQWQQWQQQYQQWQQQYGSQYEASLKAMQGQYSGPVPTPAPPLPEGSQPPLPVAPVPHADQAKPPPPCSDPSEEISEEEKNFDIQFKQWEKDFESWKQQNVNHPDKAQYSEYEKKWQSWREKLLERRKLMVQKRLAATKPPPPNENSLPKLPDLDDVPLPTQPEPVTDPYNCQPLVFKKKTDHFVTESKPAIKPKADNQPSNNCLHQLGPNWGNFPSGMPFGMVDMIRQQIEIMCSNLPSTMPLEQRHTIMHQMQMQSCSLPFNMPAEQKHMILNQMMMQFCVPDANHDKPGDDSNQPAFSTDTLKMSTGMSKADLNGRSLDRGQPNRQNAHGNMGSRPGNFGMNSNFMGGPDMGSGDYMPCGMGPGNFNDLRNMGPGNFNNERFNDGPRDGNMGPGNFNNERFNDEPRDGNMGPGNFNNERFNNGPRDGNMGPGNFNHGPRGRGARGGRFNNGSRGDDMGPDRFNERFPDNSDTFFQDTDDRMFGPAGMNRGGRGRARRGLRSDQRNAWDGPPCGDFRGGFSEFDDEPWRGNRLDPPMRGLMDSPVNFNAGRGNWGGSGPNNERRPSGPGFNPKGPWAKYERDEYENDPFADDEQTTAEDADFDGRNDRFDKDMRVPLLGNPPGDNRRFHDDEEVHGFGDPNRNVNDQRFPPRQFQGFGREDQDSRGSEPFRGGRGRGFRGRHGPDRDNYGGNNMNFGPGSFNPSNSPRTLLGGPRSDQFPPMNSSTNEHTGHFSNQDDLVGSNKFVTNRSGGSAGIPGLECQNGSNQKNENVSTFEHLKLKTNSDPKQLSGFVGNILAKLGVSGVDADAKALEVTKILLAEKPKSHEDSGGPVWNPEVHDYSQNAPPLTNREQEVRDLAFQVKEYSHGDIKTFDYGHSGEATVSATKATFDYGPEKFEYNKQHFDYGHGGSTQSIDYGHCGENKVIDYGHGGDGKTIDYGHGSSKTEVTRGLEGGKTFDYGSAPKSIDYGHGRRSPSPSSNRSRRRGRSRDNVRSPSPYRRSRSDRSPDRRWESRRDREREKDFSRSRNRDRDRRDRSPIRSLSPRRPPKEQPKVSVAEAPGTPSGPATGGVVEGVLLEDLITEPGRATRPNKLVFIMRGVSGSGKSFVTKLIKDKECDCGGSMPRILSIDDYYMTDADVEGDDDGNHKTMKYVYDADMEGMYEAALLKAYKKTISDGFFFFVIVDAVNKDLKQVEEMWSFAKQKGFQVYICEMDNDVATCLKRNIHNRTETEIQKQVDGWQPSPSHYLRLDVRSLLQSAAIEDVEMEDVGDSMDETSQQSETKEDEDEPSISNFLKSKWDDEESSGQQLDRLDGLKKKKPASMEAFLSTDDFEDFISTDKSAVPGKKRVRWADLEERQQQEKMRAIGFVVGQTDWKRMTDPTSGESALTRTKYI